MPTGEGLGLGFIAILLGIAALYASYKMWTVGFGDLFDDYAEIGWKIYLAKGLCVVFPLCGIFLQVYLAMKDADGIGELFSVGLLIHSISSFLFLVCTSCLVDGVNSCLNTFKENFLIILLMCVILGLFPAILGSIIGIISQKIYRIIKRR